jgi:DNA-binding MarR family transcriptional regulator
MVSSNSLSSNKTADDAPHLPDVLQFMQLLWAVAHGLETISKRMTVQIGVTGPQRLVLRVVGLLPGVSAGDLATILHVHPSTLTGVLKRLIAQRLLARTDDPVDRRRAVLRLTAAGTRANAARAGTVEQSITRALAGISVRDREAACRVLGRIAQHLEGGGPPAARRGGRQRRPGTGTKTPSAAPNGGRGAAGKPHHEPRHVRRAGRSATSRARRLR